MEAKYSVVRLIATALQSPNFLEKLSTLEGSIPASFPSPASHSKENYLPTPPTTNGSYLAPTWLFIIMS